MMLRAPARVSRMIKIEAPREFRSRGNFRQSLESIYKGAPLLREISLSKEIRLPLLAISQAYRHRRRCRCLFVITIASSYNRQPYRDG